MLTSELLETQRSGHLPALLQTLHAALLGPAHFSAVSVFQCYLEEASPDPSVPGSFTALVTYLHHHFSLLG